AAEVVEAELRNYLRAHHIEEIWGTQERILVGITPRSLAHQLGIHLPSAATRQAVSGFRVSSAMRSADGAAPMPAGENYPHVHADHGLDIALHRMGISGLKELPVVSRSDVTRVEGIITLDDILRVYGLYEESEREEDADQRH